MDLPMSDVKIVVMNTYWSLLKRKSRLAGQASALLSIMSSEEGRGIPACFRVPEFGNSPEREQWRAGGQWLCQEIKGDSLPVWADIRGFP